MVVADETWKSFKRREVCMLLRLDSRGYLAGIFPAFMVCWRKGEKEKREKRRFREGRIRSIFAGAFGALDH